MATTENSSDLTQTGDYNESLEDWLERFDDDSSISTISTLSTSESSASTETTEGAAPPLPSETTTSTIPGISRLGHTTIVTTPAGDKIYLNFAPPTVDPNTPPLFHPRTISSKVRARGEQIFSDMVHSTNPHQAKLSKDLAAKFHSNNQMKFRFERNPERSLGGIGVNYANNEFILENSRFEGTVTVLGKDGRPFKVSLVNGIRHEMFHFLDPIDAGSTVQQDIEQREQRAMDFTNKFRKADGMVERAEYEPLTEAEIEAWKKANPTVPILRNVDRKGDISIITTDPTHDSARLYLNFAGVSDEARVKLEILLSDISVNLFGNNEFFSGDDWLDSLIGKFGTVETALNFAYDTTNDKNLKGLQVNLDTNTILIANDNLGTEARYLGTDYFSHDFRPIDALYNQLGQFSAADYFGGSTNAELRAEYALSFENSSRLIAGLTNRVREEHIDVDGMGFYQLVWQGGVNEADYADERNANLIGWAYSGSRVFDGENIVRIDDGRNFPQQPHSYHYFESGPDNEVIEYAQPQYADPLVISLNRQSISVIDASDDTLWDYDGNGIRYSTDWIDPESAFLVYDRNENGRIDNGTEMFSSNTVKSNGLTAAHGFDALHDLDSNQDGVFDANDALFDKVAVWQDINSNGFSSTNELLSLNDVGITSISTQPHGYEDSTQFARGYLGQVTFDDGEQGTAYSLELDTNSVYRQFSQDIDIPDELSDIPDVVSSGKTLRNLREAAAYSPELEAIVRQYMAAPTREAQEALLDDLIQAWVDTSSYVQLTDRIDATDVAVGYVPVLNEAGDTIIDYEFDDTPTGKTLKFRITDLNGGYLSADELKVGRFADRPEQDPLSQFHYRPNLEALAKAQILEVFNDYSFIQFNPYLNDENLDGVLDIRTEVNVSGRTSASSTYGSTSGSPEEGFLDERHITFHPRQIAELDKAYEALKEGIYNQLLLDTRLASVVDTVIVNDSNEDGVSLDFSGLDEHIDNSIDADFETGVNDLVDLNYVTDNTFISFGFNGWQKLSDTLNENSSGGELEYVSRKVDFATDGYFGGKGDNVVLGNDEANRIADTGDRPYVYGGDGRDIITSVNNNSGVVLDGGVGNDEITTRSSSAILVGGADNDTLTVEGLDTKDVVLSGGKGTDTLSGGRNRDIYIFNLGDGVDTIIETEDRGFVGDILRLGPGIAGIGQDITVSHDGYDLLLTHDNGTDQVRIKDWYKYASVDGRNVIETVEFASGHVWQASRLTQLGLTVNGTGENDTIDGVGISRVYNSKTKEYENIGDAYANIISGGGGQDTITGGQYSDGDVLEGGTETDVLIGGYYSQNTTLFGGHGDDELEAGSSSDNTILIGGEGNDTLTGRSLSDTYLFNYGDGFDTIYESRESAGDDVVDRLVFGGGIYAEDITVSRSNTDLVLSHNNGIDQITVVNWFNHRNEAGDYKLDVIEFNDGTVWSAQDLTSQLMIQDGLDNVDDTLVGLDKGKDRNSENGDWRWGYSSRSIVEDANILNGGSGNDTLIGGLGSNGDVLTGGLGEDNLYASGYSRNNVLTGGDGKDKLYAQKYSRDTILDGGDKDDELYVDQFAENTVLRGGDGNDVLDAHVRSKNNTHIGGLGDDEIDGSSTKDTYIFNLGDGHDEITDYGISPGYEIELQPNQINFDTRAEDVLQFGAGLKKENMRISQESELHIVLTFLDDQGNETGDKITIRSAYAYLDSFQIELFTFANGDVVTGEEVYQIAHSYQGEGGFAVGNSGNSNTDPNNAPTVNNAINDISADEDVEFNFQIPAGSFTDLDGDHLTYSVTLADGSDLPAWLSFDIATQTFNGTPANDDVANLEVKVTATDIHNDSVSDVFNLNVNNINDAPELNYDVVIPYQITSEDAYFEFTIPTDAFVDPDAGDTLSYSAFITNGIDSQGNEVILPLPAWLSFDAATQTFSGTPTNDDVGTLDIKVTATDGNGASVFDYTSIIVENVNDAPVFVNAIDDQVLTEGESFSFEIPLDTFLDVDGDAFVYQASLSDGSDLPSWLSFDGSTGTFSGTPNSSDLGSFGVKVTAIDYHAFSDGDSVSDIFMLTTVSSQATGGGGAPLPPPGAYVDDSYTLNYDASNGWLSSNYWYDTTNVSGYNLELDGEFFDEIPQSNFAGITHSFYFDGYGGGTMADFAGLPGDQTTNDASFELWFRPQDLYEDEVLFETGGYGFLGSGTGTSLIIVDEDNDGWSDDLQFVVKNGSTKRTLTADLSYILGGISNVTDEFIQVVGTYDKNAYGSTDEVTLYVNGVEADYDTATGLNDWASTNDTGIGRVNGSINVGNSNVSNFEGDIAKFRFYEHSLSSSTVAENFNAVALEAGEVNTGSSASESVIGTNQDDVLGGGAGDDYLAGFGGNDNYHFSRGDDHDTITDNSGDDIVNFGDISHDALWFSQSGDDLDITVVGTDDTLTIQDWYSNSNARIETFATTEDGGELLASQVEQLVSAMASYNVPSGAGNVIPQETRDALQPVLASSWS